MKILAVIPARANSKGIFQLTQSAVVQQILYIGVVKWRIIKFKHLEMLFKKNTNL